MTRHDTATTGPDATTMTGRRSRRQPLAGGGGALAAVLAGRGLRQARAGEPSAGEQVPFMPAPSRLKAT
jgi:hypothetical protein